MPFIRRALLVALFASALITLAGAPNGNAAARPWRGPTVAYSSSGNTPNTGEPDAGSTRTPKSGNGSITRSPGIGAIKVASMRWLGWIWAGRYFGMGN